MVEFPIKVTNTGGAADLHRIRMIDASDMYSGLHRAISYCLLSLEAGQLIERATHNSSVQIYQRRTADNCLTHELIVEIGSVGFLAGIVGNVAATYFCKFLDFSFKAAAGLLTDPTYENELKTYQRVDPFFDDLVEKIEPHLLNVHAPIQISEKVEVKFDATHVTTFDADSKDYLSGNNISREKFAFSGNVTRLNIVSGNGRFFANELGYIVPFSQQADFRARSGSKHLSWSLRQKDRNRPATLEIVVNKITSNSGRLKRLRIRKAKRLAGESPDEGAAAVA